MAWSDTWRPEIDGTGQVTFSADGRLARFEAPAPSRAMLRCVVPAVPGARIDFVYSARIVDAPDPAIPPFGAIDLFYPFELVEQWDYTTEWKEYRVSYTVPYTATARYVSMPVGVFNAQSGVLEATQPRIIFQGDDANRWHQQVVFEGREAAVTNVVETSAAGTINDWRRYDFAHAVFASGDDDDLENSRHLWIDLNALKRPDGTFKSSFFQAQHVDGTTNTIAGKRDLIIRANASIGFGGATIGTYYLKRLVLHKVPMVTLEDV